MNLAALVLASGASRRLGFPKQAVPVAGEPLLHRTARCAVEAGFAPVRVVLGAGAAELAPLVSDLPVACVANPGWEEGMASSIRAGLRDLPPSVEGVLLLVCDQVRLEADVLTRLGELHRAAPHRPAACLYGGVAGVPAIFPRSAWGALERLSGDQGARSLLRGGGVSLLPWPEGERDLDLGSDLDGA